METINLSGQNEGENIAGDIMIEEMQAGEFLSKSVETPKVWRADWEGKPIIEFEAWVSTEGIDRDGEIIRVSGWRKASLQNPKLLCFHDHHDLPLGKPYWTRPKELDGIKGLYTKGRMGPQLYGLAVGELYLQGDMDSFSVGFKWYKRIFDEEGDGIKKPYYEYIDQELYEYSAVNVPANPEATIAMSALITDAKDIKDMMAIIKGFAKPQEAVRINQGYVIKAETELHTKIADLEKRLEMMENYTGYYDQEDDLDIELPGEIDVEIDTSIDIDLEVIEVEV
jgi:HK97 family phage prohead protease